jgi:membrane complex biogenesis BtpA family protein
MIHVGALPGTPRAERSVHELATHVAMEARQLASAGFDAILVENMHDAPYLNGGVGAEITAAMTACAIAAKDAAPELPLGVQILAAANHEALAVVLAAGAQFIRAENYVFAHTADEGLMPTAAAGPLLRHRRAIGGEHIAVFADIKKKHSAHALTSDVSVAETARAAHFFEADALIVTGVSTGEAAPVADIEAAARAVPLPVLAGSGATPENIDAVLATARAAIVGSWIKEGGDWRRPVDRGRACAMVEAAKA